MDSLENNREVDKIERREADRHRFAREYVTIRDQAVSAMGELDEIEQLQSMFTVEDYEAHRRNPNNFSEKQKFAMERVSTFRHDIVNLLPMKSVVSAMSGQLEGIIGSEIQIQVEKNAETMLGVIAKPSATMRSRLQVSINFIDYMLGVLYPEKDEEEIRKITRE